MGVCPVQPGDVLADKYEIERVLGEGGMGVVVAARHLELDQRVAVKFLLAEIAEHRDAAERFRREARAAVKITSEHVARVMDVGVTDDGVPYMVMEYLEGNDLSAELASQGPLPLVDAVDYVIQACEAVAEAHASGIVHRDLKPANLFLHQKADGSQVVKVLDFGISKSVTGGSVMDLALTSTAALIGSPLYMSPEQMHSARTVDARTDIWALGAITFQLLSGRPPYVAESLPQLCTALIHDVPPALTSLRPEIPQELEDAVMGALAKDREERYQSVLEFVEALAPFASASSGLHLQRVARLSGTDPGLRASRAPRTTRVAPPTSPTAATLQVGSTGTITESAWGKTGDPPTLEAPPKRGWIPAAAVGAVVAVALIAFGISRTQASAASAPADKSPAVADAPATPAEPAEAPAELAPPAVAPVPPTASVAEAEADAAAPELAAPEVTKPSRPSRPTAPRRDPPSSPVPTDFGGRR